MHKEKIKNLILIFLILVAIYLSSQNWLQLNFNNTPKTTNVNNNENIYLWDKIRPSKCSVTESYEYWIYNSEYINDVWIVYLDTIRDIFRNAYIGAEVKKDDLDSNNIKINFETPISSDLFIEGLSISNNKFLTQIKYIFWIAYSIDTNLFYVNDGIDTYSLSIETNQFELVNKYNQILIYAKNNYDDLYSSELNSLIIPVSSIQKVKNPIFIKSEIDIEDTSYIEKIAKDYFKENYDYVRTTVESSGNINYVYRNEKVLKIYKEGLLEFYDSMESTMDDSNIYDSMKIGLNFINDFLGFPENAYLSEVNTFQKDGKIGYSFIFSYNLLDRPIIFSQIREEKAIKIDVVGSKVIYYQRFIREIDNTMEAEMKEVEVISPQNIIKNNIDFITTLYLENTLIDNQEFEETKSKILNSIKQINLAYFDPSRKSKDQLLRSVWVITTDDRQYVFNAISGAIIEEQIINQEVKHGLE